MEGDPFALLEAMTIEAFATGCATGYLYIRGEYPEAEATMAAAIAAARDAGLLGPNILGSGFSFDIEIRRGAGAYICGEETALFNSIEGKRGEPRNKPPFPVEVGLFGKPTVVNNVETLVNVPLIMQRRRRGVRGRRHGSVDRPEALLPVGARRPPGRLRGAVRHDAASSCSTSPAASRWPPIQAILLGGAAGAFVGPDDLDMPLTFEGTRAIGATLGSGVVMVFDETADLVETLRRIAQFFRDESCGQCVPCRVGTVRQEELLARLATDRPIGSAADELASCARSARRCATPRSAASARRPRRRSRARSPAGWWRGDRGAQLGA